MRRAGDLKVLRKLRLSLLGNRSFHIGIERSGEATTELAW